MFYGYIYTDMHDCALGREGEPSAPRVEHRYYACDGIIKTGRGGGEAGGGGGKKN